MEILILGAIACITALIVTAWIMTFARWFPIKGIEGENFLIDYKTMIRGHVDYALMALFCMGFFGVANSTQLELNLIACWCVVIGGFVNPSIFIVAAFNPDFWSKKIWKVVTALSFVLTTIGFMTIVYQFYKFFF